jgi:hypothetical protein
MYHVAAQERLTLLLLAAVGLGGLALTAGYLLLRHDVLMWFGLQVVDGEQLRWW